MHTFARVCKIWLKILYVRTSFSSWGEGDDPSEYMAKHLRPCFNNRVKMWLSSGVINLGGSGAPGTRGIRANDGVHVLIPHTMFFNPMTNVFISNLQSGFEWNKIHMLKAYHAMYSAWSSVGWVCVCVWWLVVWMFVWCAYSIHAYKCIPFTLANVLLWGERFCALCSFFSGFSATILGICFFKLLNLFTKFSSIRTSSPRPFPSASFLRAMDSTCVHFQCVPISIQRT